MDPRPLAFEREDHGPAKGVVTIRLEQPERKVVVMDRALVRRLDATVDAIGEGAAGVVLSSPGKVFVAGADLREIDGLSDGELDAYLAEGQRVLGRFASMACTTVAAVSGAALGGGLELAMHCDALLGLRPSPEGKGYAIGLVEATLGLCPGWGGSNLLPARVEPGLGIGMTASGATMTAQEALERGVFESLHDSFEDLLAAAKRRAAQPKPKRGRSGEPANISQPAVVERTREALKRIERDLPDTDAARAVAACVRAGCERGWAAALKAEREALIRLRGTAEAKAKLKAFFEKSGGR